MVYSTLLVFRNIKQFKGLLNIDLYQIWVNTFSLHAAQWIFSVLYSCPYSTYFQLLRMIFFASLSTCALQSLRQKEALTAFDLYSFFFFFGDPMLMFILSLTAR